MKINTAEIIHPDQFDRDGTDNQASVIGPHLGATDETTAAKRCDGRCGGFSVVVG